MTWRLVSRALIACATALVLCLAAPHRAAAQGVMYNFDDGRYPPNRLLSQDEGATVAQLIQDSDRRSAAGDHEGAIADVRQIVAIDSAAFGPDNPLTISAMGMAAIDLGSAGHFDEAFTIQHRVKATWETVFGPTSLEYADAVSHEGRLLRMINDVDAARKDYLLAISILEARMAGNSTISADNLVQVTYRTALFNLAETDNDMGADDEAQAAMSKLAQYARQIGASDVVQLAASRLAGYAEARRQFAASTHVMSSARFAYNVRVTDKVRDLRPSDIARMQQLSTEMQAAAAANDASKASASMKQLLDLMAQSVGPNDPFAMRLKLAYVTASAVAPSPDDLALAVDDDARTRHIYGPDSLERAASLYTHGMLLMGHMRAQSCSYFTQALSITDELKGERYTGALDLLDAAALCELGEQDNPELAVQLFDRELSLQNGLGQSAVDTSMTLARLGHAYAEEGQFARAEALLLQAQKAVYAHGQNTADAAEIDYDLGDFYLTTGRLTDADPLLERAFRIRSASNGLVDEATLATLFALNDLYALEGLPAKTQPLLQPVISNELKVLSDGKSGILVRAMAADGLLRAYADGGRSGEAVTLMRDHPELFQFTTEQGAMGEAFAIEAATVSLQAGQSADGCETLRRQEAGGAPADMPKAVTVTELLRRSLDIRCAIAAGHAGDGVTLAQANLRAIEALYGENSITTAGAQALLAYAQMKADDPASALSAMRAAVAIQRRLQTTSATGFTAEQALAKSRSDQGIAPTARSLFTGFVAVASHVAAVGPTGDAVGDEAFQAAQDAAISPASKALQEALARAAGTPDQAALARTYQNQVETLQALGLRLSRAVAQGDTDDAAALRGQIDQQSGLLAQTSLALADRFPAYEALVRPRPLSVGEVQKRLASDEALVLILPASTASDATLVAIGAPRIEFEPDALFVFVVTKSSFVWKRVDGGLSRTSGAVQKLLCDIDSEDCPSSPGSTVAEAFDAKTAYQLYQDTLAFAEPVLSGVHRLYLSTTGDLSRLPLSLLVTSDPAGADLAHLAWLGDRFAITSLPSVPGLGFSAATPAARGGSSAPFVGYGAPTLQPPGGMTRVVRSGSINGDWFTAAPQAGVYLADPSKFRTLPSLPGAARELSELAAIAGAPDATGAIHVGAADAEGLFKTDPAVASARILAIATHGVFPRSRDATFEPGLVFTPPATPTLADDGLLTASEVLGLRLSADWVILSACDTATGEAGGDDLSSLSRAFLFAGAHSLLASHWRVADDATDQLVTTTLRIYASGHAGLTRAQALQQAMRQLRQDPKYAHPRYWAPFTVISNQDD